MKRFISIMTVSGLAAASHAQFFGVNNLADTNFGTGGDTLIQFDFFNPNASSPVGTLLTRADTGAALSGIGGLDFGDGLSNTLYAGDAFGANPGEIFTVDFNTGVATSLGTVAGGAINDLAWNPITQDLYAVVGDNQLWANVDDPTNAINLGTFSIPDALDVGLAFDSQGNVHVHDVVSDTIYAGSGVTTAVSALHATGFNANFSQGMFIDHSRDDQGYLGAINGDAITSDNYVFGSLADGGDFGPLVSSFDIDAGSGLPTVELGDLTRTIVPTPGVLSIAGIAGIVAARRRR